MTKKEVLEKLEKCYMMTEMDYAPEIAFEDDEDGDTRFWDETGAFVIYDVTTTLRAEDFKAVRYKGHDDFCRDPYVAILFHDGRRVELSCVPGRMQTPNIGGFIRELIRDYGGVIDPNSPYAKEI